MDETLRFERLELDDLPIEPSSPSSLSTSDAHTMLAYSTSRQRLLEERARVMFAKYNLSMGPEDMPLYVLDGRDEPVERVHRPIRVRVHRYCHRCETAFVGSEKSCESCGHARCKKCPRYPKEQDEGGAEGNVKKKKKRHVEGAEEVEGREPLRMVQNPRKNPLLIHKPPVQRIRRKCHKCDASFVTATATVCENCGHTRCTKCPRNPEKRSKWTHGYPGDARPSSDEDENSVPHGFARQERVYREVRQRVRWNCEQCESVFLEGTVTCRDCGHTKCDECNRQPPKRKRDAHDHFAADEALHNRLNELMVGSSTGSD